jgi:anthranilate phosphoribosyltransferase
LGVFDRKWVEPVAQVLSKLGSDHALVVASYDGLDEVSPAGATRVCEVKGSQMRTYDLVPEDLGLARQELASIAGGDAADNSARLEAILKGTSEAAATAVALNAGAALYVGGVASSLRQGVDRARTALQSQAAWQTLKTWAAWTQALPAGQV